MSDQDSIYLDHAATTPCDPRVVDAMNPYFTEVFGNPSTMYEGGRKAKQALEGARETIANAIGAKPEEIIFTSGGTESDNHAIIGLAEAGKMKGKKHIVTTPIEHHAVLEPAEYLKARGFELTILPVDEHGIVHPEEVKKVLRDDTAVVSIMHSNNEVGTIQPLSEISKVTKEAGVPLHTDAVQSFGSVPVNVDDLGCDLLSISSHKFYGPKGVGALYVRKGTRIRPLIRGGAQERNRRASTENISGIIGLAKAAEIALAEMEVTSARITKLRDRLVNGLFNVLTDIRHNGHPTERLPNNVNICVRGVEGEAMLLFLDMKGISASSGSACSSGSLEPSHVLRAMGIPQEVAHGSLRFTLGKKTTEEQIDKVLAEIPAIVDRLRQMTPYQQPPEHYKMPEWLAAKA